MAISLDGTSGISASGNISGNNVVATGTLSAGVFSPSILSVTGNVTGDNLLTGGLVSATGNVTGAYIFGNGALLSGVVTSVANINSGTSNVTVNGSNGNVTTSVGGVANIVVVNTTGMSLTGDLTVTGNATLSGNILGDRIQNGTTTIDIQTQNGNANISIGGTSNVAVFATTGEYVTGLISATGNITGSYIIGNGSQLTGLPAGYSNADVATYLASNSAVTITTTNAISSFGNITGANLLTGGLISATGNVSGGNLNVTGNIVDSGALSIITGSNGNIALAPNGTGIVTASGAVSAVGNITGSYILGNGSQLTGVSATLTYSTGTATGDGTTVAFTISAGRAVDNILVFVNGICFVPTTDYTIASTTLTFVTAPANLAEITFRYLPI